MSSLDACRMCLAVDTRLCQVAGTSLQEVYERMTKLPLKSGDGKPVLACYVCHHLLRRSQTFIERSIKADKLLQGILHSEKRITKKSLSRLHSTHLTPLLSVFSNHATESKSPDRITESPDRITESPVRNTRSPDRSTNSPKRGFQSLKGEMQEIPIKIECVVDRFDENEDDGREFGGYRTVEVLIKEEPPDLDEDVPAPELGGLAPQPGASGLGVWPLGVHGPMGFFNILSPDTNQNETSIGIDEPHKKMFPCTLCDRTFKWSGHLKSHMRIHTGERPYQCNQCEKAFSNSSNLKTHKKIHSGEKPFQCSECHRTFAENGALKLHMRIHTGEKPYQCSECDKAFVKSSKLKDHMRLHTGEKPYQCNQCDRAFSGSSSLKFHVRSHTGERPFPCDKCDHAFAQKSALNVHMRLHTGEKPFLCTICDRAFIRKDLLKSHLQTHMGEKPYACGHCPEAFRWKSSLVTHMKVHAKEKV